MVADVTFLFNDWEAVWRVLFIALAGYVTLVVLLRASGQRTLAQLSSVDFIITVTIGSAFGRVLTARDVAVVEVIAAFGALVALQQVVAWLWGRSPGLRAYVTSPPAVLYRSGELFETVLRRKGLRQDDLRTAARQAGFGSLNDVEVIMLESNGAFSVVASVEPGSASTLGSDGDDETGA